MNLEEPELNDYGMVSLEKHDKNIEIIDMINL